MDVSQLPAMQDIEEYLQTAQMNFAAFGGLRKKDVFTVLSTLKRKYTAIIEDLAKQLEDGGQISSEAPAETSAQSVPQQQSNSEHFELPPEPAIEEIPSPVRQGAQGIPPDVVAEYQQAIQQYKVSIAQAQSVEKEADAARKDYVTKALYLSDAITQARHEKEEIVKKAQSEADNMLEKARKDGQECLQKAQREAAMYLERTRENIRKQIDEGDKQLEAQKEAIRTIKRETVQIVKKAGYILDHVEKDMRGSVQEITGVRKKLQEYMPQSEALAPEQDDAASQEGAVPVSAGVTGDGHEI